MRALVSIVIYFVFNSGRFQSWNWQIEYWLSWSAGWKRPRLKSQWGEIGRSADVDHHFRGQFLTANLILFRVLSLVLAIYMEKSKSVVAMPPVRTWNDINKILDSIDWSEFFKTIDANNQFQTLGRSLKPFWSFRDFKDRQLLPGKDSKSPRNLEIIESLLVSM